MGAENAGDGVSAHGPTGSGEMEAFAAACARATAVCLAYLNAKPFIRRGVRTYGGATPWDINDGLCDWWAGVVCEAVPDAEALWLDDIVGVGGAHCAVRWRGRWYDAEATEGVDRPELLPFSIAALSDGPA